MSIHVEAKISVNRKRGDVAKVMFNPKLDKLWVRGTKVYPMESGLYRKGAKIERVGNFLGKAYSAKTLVTKAVEKSIIEIYSDEPFEMKLRYQLTDIDDDGTLVKISISSFGEMPFNTPISIISKKVQENVETDLKRLKRHLELPED